MCAQLPKQEEEVSLQACQRPLYPNDDLRDSAHAKGMSVAIWAASDGAHSERMTVAIWTSLIIDLLNGDNIVRGGGVLRHDNGEVVLLGLDCERHGDCRVKVVERVSVQGRSV